MATRNKCSSLIASHIAGEGSIIPRVIDKDGLDALERRCLVAHNFFGFNKMREASKVLSLSQEQYITILSSQSCQEALKRGWEPSWTSNECLAILSHEAMFGKRAQTRLYATKLLMQYKGMLKEGNQLNVQINNPFEAYSQ